jgi:LDH2 family malate/lactate/ureidoglycolate dehydrogenase
MPPSPKIVVPTVELTGFVAELFARAGTSAEHAATITDVLLWASLRGVDSHGVSRVPRYLELLASGEANASPHIRLTSYSPAVAVVDADRAPGPVALTLAAAEVVGRARANGIGAVGVRRTVHTGAIGHYTSRIADEGLIGIAFVAGMPNMAYTGVKGAAVATSPLSIAVPVQGRTPLLLDMATAGIALGKIAQFRNAGRELPEGTAAMADGTPTTDPNLAKMPLPLGGPKGAGMSLAFELITSVLLAEPILSSFHGDDPEGRKHRQNALLLALDPNAFGGDGFTAAAADTVEALKGLPRADEGTEIHYPGERSASIAVDRAAKGVPVDAKVWSELETAAGKLGVAVPERAS